MFVVFPLGLSVLPVSVNVFYSKTAFSLQKAAENYYYDDDDDATSMPWEVQALDPGFNWI